MKTQHTTNRIKGMTLIEVLVVIAVIVVLAAMLLPTSGSHNIAKIKRIVCVNNLKQVGLAYRVWESDNGGKYPMGVSATNIFALKLMDTGSSYVLWRSLSNELNTPKILHCPADNQRTNALSFAHGFSDANISYFFSFDGAKADPQMMLVGDDNLVVDGARVPPGILNLATNSSVAWTKERHNGAGNVGLADGSVQMVSNMGLKLLLVMTNRLVIP